MFVFVKVQLYFKHVPRTKMEKKNGLSRRLDWKVGVEKNNEN